jgi:D-alanyl-D-alanine carboxypeptidase/D-alanyl-D-alanine-endopeptidase (penicillin-binding protein 4)
MSQEMVIVDGSGLSRYNLVTPAQFADFLCRMRQDFKCSKEFISSLSISGVDGTLKKTMNEKMLVSRVCAKTGSMTGISALVGYITTEEGKSSLFR